ncbi:MAG: tyrosine-protein kinase family protein [Rhizobacter sp.]|nr:tyrosine-protein kinase family protein [Rhizobacter sp.]
MSSLIEQAAQRLEQLRKAGIVLPDPTPPPSLVQAVDGAAAVHAFEVAPVAQKPPVVPPAMSKHVELNLDALAGIGIVTPDAPRSQMADQYRVIKRPLIANAMGKGTPLQKHGNLIMVTSALAGEGKSYTSVNLAISIAAEMDNTVMLVDADVARPSLLRMLNLPPSRGLLDLLEGRADMSSVLLRTSIDKLTILPSGSPHPRATELLASDAMRLLLEDMAQRYADRIIIFDSPPLLLTTEARVLASQMGQVVMVVQAERTSRADVQHALSTIESCPVRLMVLNLARANNVGGYGGRYEYGYGYMQEQPVTG